ncbi:response regulator [Methyloceanibacter sp.]|uniref:response regulator n=1 Tax=Methyloceanibacter sp. TaxID=1965321 RepID=UPI002D3C3429|nr:response regulator [Methyloceanibacter sp.]HZP08662.1 response regulator [Methyloceanibacter sp.]
MVPKTQDKGDASPEPGNRAPTILLVDDEALIRAMLSDYLQECGYKVLEASTGEEAILILDTAHVAVDLVFTDISMPGSVDGFALSKWVHANRPGMPVILTSGDGRKTEAAMELCEDQPFIEKPYDLKMVVAQIRASINKARTNPKR